MIAGFHHIGVTVRDLDRSLGFYHDLLGLEILSRREDITAAYVRALVGIPDARLRSAMLASPGGGRLELIQYMTPPGADRVQEPNDVPCTHFAITVDDLAVLVRRLRAEGHALVSEPQVSPAGPSAGTVFVYLRDPDGALVELVQPSRPSGKDEEAARP